MPPSSDRRATCFACLRSKILITFCLLSCRALQQSARREHLVQGEHGPSVSRAPTHRGPVDAERDVAIQSHLASRSAKLEGRFCTYANDGGFNNRLQALQIALLLCQATDRTLIVQPFTTGHNEGLEVEYTYFLEPIVDHPVVLARDLDLALVSTQDIDLHGDDCDVGLSSLTENYANSDAQVLRFPDPWGYWESMFQQSDHEAIRAALEKSIHFSAGVRAGAEGLLQWLPQSWSAAHARLTDRPGLVLLDCEAVGLAVGSPELLFREGLNDAEVTAINDGCALELSDGSLRINDLETGFKTFPTAGVSNVYIATDDPMDARLARIHESLQSRGVRSLSWEDFPAYLRDQAITLANQQKLAFASYAQVEALMREKSNLLKDAGLIEQLDGGLADTITGFQYPNMSAALTRRKPFHRQSLEKLSDKLAKIKRDLPQRDGALISCIEQVLCMEAPTLLPSWPSSWDALVIDKRLQSGRTDAAQLMQLMRNDLMRREACKARS